MKPRIFLSLILLLVFIFFIPSLSLYFASDDFYYLNLNRFSDIFTFKSGFYHYNPFYWFIIWLTKSFAGFNPFPFHMITVIFHLLNIYAVFLLGKILLKNTKKALLSGFIFAFFFGSYEVVYWISGLNTSPMVFFYILGLVSFIEFVRSGRIIKYYLFILFLLLSVLCHEYAISLPVVCLIYWIMFNGRKPGFIRGVQLFSVPLLIPAFLLILKLFYSHAPLAPAEITVPRFSASFMKSILYLFIPNPYIIDRIPQIILVGIFICLTLLLMARIRLSKLPLFLFLWLSIAVVLFSATSLPKSPYFYLSFIPAVYLITIGVVSRTRNNPFLSGIYLFFILISGIFFLSEQRLLWATSAYITRNILVNVKSAINNPSPGGKIVFLNIPDSVNGPPWHAYIFRNGLPEALSMMYGRNIQVNLYRFNPSFETARDDPFIQSEKLADLIEKGTKVFLYQQSKQTVKLLQKNDIMKQD